MALTAATCEAIWLQNIIEDINFPVPRPTVIFEDNQGAIQIAKNPEHHKRTKHIDIKHHFIKDAIRQELKWNTFPPVINKQIFLQKDCQVLLSKNKDNDLDL
ncbi:hypothetical protein JTB14_013593 [Gonioctena quinquepunctata]|nr:hypothetical protein JTB14_013593 [Gonioctena quinquepunctata]